MNSTHILALVGTGIKTVAHLTLEAKSLISEADKLLYLLNEPLTQKYVANLTKGESENLDSIYFSFDKRADAYNEITKTILRSIKSHENVCVAIYGHPCVYAESGLAAIREAEKYSHIKTIVSPGISSQDCMFADLRFDPAINGCLTLDASSFVFSNKKIDPSYDVVLFQIGMIGNEGLPTSVNHKKSMIKLQEKLIIIYGANKTLILYEASLYPNVPPKIKPIKISELLNQEISPIASAFIRA